MQDMIKEAEKVRKQWAESDAERDRGDVMCDVRVIKDTAYTSSASPDEEKWHLTDIYYPAGESGEAWPVIVNIHGGGWFYGDKELYSLYAAHMAAKGYAVVNFNYRLSPEYMYPCGFEDVCRVMEFVSENAEKYSFDMTRLYITGDSCGAQLGFQYCVYALSEEYRKFFSFSTDRRPVPEACALNCGIYTPVPDEDSMLLGWYTGGEAVKSLTDCIDYVNEKFPRTYLMASVNDGLCPRTEVLVKKLTELGTEFEHHLYGKENPDNGHVFHLNLRNSEAVLCNENESRFFKSE